MSFRKRLGTGILAAMMVVSSLQFPGWVSYAAELPANGIEDVQEMPVQMETAKSGTDTPQDLSEEETGQPENDSGSDDKAGEEDREADSETDGTEQPDGQEQAGNMSDAEAEDPSDIEGEVETPSDESGVTDDAMDSEETILGEQVSGNDAGVSHS